ncbi:MAG: carbamoyltransferase [Candidatus Hydrothermia bacterium]
MIRRRKWIIIYDLISLGIHDGHTATAAVVVDGKLVSAVSEERLNRQKEWGGFPERAISEATRLAGADPKDISVVGIATFFPPITSADYEMAHPGKRLFWAASRVMPKPWLYNGAWLSGARFLSAGIVKRRKRSVVSRLADMGISAPTLFYEHHDAHGLGAHLFSGREENLVLTADGSGDMLSATVALGRGKKLVRLSSVSNYNSIGEFYTRITQYLGMKPLSHEYKVMGLAPYAPEDMGEGAYDKLRKYFSVIPDKLAFINRSGAWKRDYLRKLNKDLAGFRFDAVAFAAQRILEETILAWAESAIKKTRMSSVALAGGVFMNVKLNNLLLEAEGVDELFIMPSAGDESLALAAALMAYLETGNGDYSALETLYLGPEFTEEQIRKAFDELGEGFAVSHEGDGIHEQVGQLLAQGKIIARFYGKMEFGARALGNRSILADPRNREVVDRINRAIKMRDFWMPFAPTILHERRHDYLVNPKDHPAPYMMIAFPTTPLARREIPAALHPADGTGRPQVLRKEQNPTYYRVIKAFEAKTGVGAVLNTSFNLHGDPIVCSPRDAVYTLLKSDLDGLAIGEWLVLRKR